MIPYLATETKENKSTYHGRHGSVTIYDTLQNHRDERGQVYEQRLIDRRFVCEGMELDRANALIEAITDRDFPKAMSLLGTD